ncbi:transcription factor GTE11 isoform X2 [Ziziphus jujuba]|uniref:Transcription factor GTE11 isoform X2 n=1 Tax=Ziziphus jujuba TaxID=326968 RepID=A0ABM3IIN8_ZIZJJ|nr:transcription factor GTE11 isoform X2 [Ziziphus jujuba]
MMTTESIVPIRRLKVKLPKKRTEADHGTHFEHQVKTASIKRGATDMIEGHKQKRQKLDRSMTMQCSAILKKLMSHDAAWVFNQPVDPVKLNIPDYFSVISSPMDLGTVKSKLEKNMYSRADEFADDVRLTFSNAMLYNPPSNVVHQMALNLNQIFEMRWKVFEEKSNHECSTVRPRKSSSGSAEEFIGKNQNDRNAFLFRSSSVPKRSIPSEQKIRRCSFNASDDDVEHSKTAKNCKQKSLGRNVKKGTGTGSSHAFCSVNAKRLSSPTADKCITCGAACQCIPSNLSTNVSSSERSSLGRDNHFCRADIVRLDCQAKSTAESHMSKSDQDSDVSALDDVNVCTTTQLTTPVTDATCGGEGWNTSLFDVQLSPEKALRAAMLKRRFADTILKAQQKTILDHGDNTDPVKIQQEKKRLERRQREEKARIEAELEAAQAASKRAEIEFKKQLEKEREAARAAIDKMERSVVIEQNFEIQKELEKLSGCSLFHILNSVDVMRSFGRTNLRSPLEQLGLFMKDEYLADEDEDSILNGDGEEGEIF